jgi:APA family basic amino acid/polyamine antiporter
MSKKLFLRKPLQSHFDSVDPEHHGLHRHLGWFQLVVIGIGAIIGAGIFVVTGKAAAEYAGPAIIISFVLASLICLFAGLCYAELSSLIHTAGGSYAYSYVALGEFPAWMIGWSVTAQYLVSAATVAVGWSGYFASFLRGFGVTLSPGYSLSPLHYAADTGWQLSGSFINLPALLMVAAIGILISVGIRVVSHFTSVMVVIKLSTIALFILLGLPFIQTENWHPFIPENMGTFGEFGWSGIFRAAGLVFFAYIGFDTVSTLSQDAKNPQKDVPRGILGSLLICTIAYIVVSLILTGIVHYDHLNVSDPIAVALDVMGPSFFWLIFIVKLAILAGLASVVLVQMLGQTRIFLAISHDGLLPSALARIHPKSRTPIFATYVTAVITEIPTTAATAPNSHAGSSAAPDSGAVHPGLKGATLADAPEGDGVIVKAVEPRSAAEAAAIRVGDRIEGANRQTIAGVKELRDVAKRGGALVLTIRRGNQLMLVPLRAP